MHYVVIIDLENPEDNEYQNLYANIKNIFPDFCQILSNACLIKTDKSSSYIKKWFQDHMNTNDEEIAIFVAAYNKENYSECLNPIVRVNIDKL